MPKVFISYRRNDTDASAGRLFDKLSPVFGKDDVFYDRDTIDLGVDFVRELQNQVGSCDVLLALIGPRWEVERLQNERDFVRLEIAAALERDIRVIPVLVDGVTLPKPSELPGPLVPLLNRQALDLNHARFHTDCERLIRAIKRVQPQVSAAVVPRLPVRWKKPALAAGALVAMLATYPLVRRPVADTGSPQSQAAPPVTEKKEATPDKPKEKAADERATETRKQDAAPVAKPPAPTPAQKKAEAEKETRASSPPARQPGATFVLDADGLTYSWIPPGKFMMGCSPGDSDCDSDEKPPREVTIARGFWMSQTEVTQAAWRKVMGAESPSHFKGDRLPVEQVTWTKAREYCAKIGGRLPTESEWEYAARAGSQSARYGDIGDVAWFSGNSSDKTHPVGQKRPNAWGLYDALGNVWEWTAEEETVRGGSWFFYPRSVRVSVRGRGGAAVRSSGIGFRCAGEFR